MIDKIILKRMNKVFHEHLPDTLYQSHYDLATNLGSTPNYWKKFLKDPENQRFIELEIASITESAARSALKNLSNNKTSSSDIAAAKSLLENSKLLQQKHNPKQHIIMHYLPPRKEMTMDEYNG